MIICHCAAVSDRDIQRAIRKGATTLNEVSRATGAARCCGSCRSEVAEILTQTVAADQGTANVPLGAVPVAA